MTCQNPLLLEEDLTFLQCGVTSGKLCLTNLIALCAETTDESNGYCIPWL